MMTTEQAIRILNPDADVVWKAYDGKDMERCNEACRLACFALAKQIPKKPIKKPTNSFFADLRCPECKTLIARHQKYCKECGQALDWSDEE